MNILCKQKLLFWMRLITINRLTPTLKTRAVDLMCLFGVINYGKIMLNY